MPKSDLVQTDNHSIKICQRRKITDVDIAQFIR